MPAPHHPLFAAKPDDPKDVSWALTTADTCWKRGERGEALKWLRRAVEAASEAELDDRYLELAKIAADITTQIGSMAPPPDAKPTAPRAPLPARTAPVAPAAPRLGASKAPLPARAVHAKDAHAKEGHHSKDAQKKADRKSLSGENPRPRANSEHSLPKPEPSGVTMTQDSPRKRTNSRVDKAEAQQRRSSRTDEIDAWPTENVAARDLPAELSMDRTTNDGKPAARSKDGLVVSQALRVYVFRAPDGTVQLGVHTDDTATPSGAALATLVALEPDADLASLFKT